MLEVGRLRTFAAASTLHVTTARVLNRRAAFTSRETPGDQRDWLMSCRKCVVGRTHVCNSYKRVFTAVGTGPQLTERRHLCILTLRSKNFHVQAITLHRARGGMVPRILNLSTRRRWEVNCTPRPIYSHGKSPVAMESEAGCNQCRLLAGR
jgi:hypothetical protein